MGISGCPYHIGDFAQGGVIIFLTHDGMHGLVAAIDDALTEVEWSINPAPTTATNNDPLPYTTPSAPHGQYYGGYKNQQAIQGITNWATIYPAFAAAADYSITVNGVKYDDWWLPSSTELSLIYAFRGVINQVSVANGGSLMTKIATHTYWSSREDDNFNAWGLIFSDGTQSNTFGKSNKNAMRCVRAF